MADWERHEETTKRVIYSLPSPTNWAEVAKVVAAIRSDLGEEKSRWDDVVTVEAWDDQIRFSYVVEVAQ